MSPKSALFASRELRWIITIALTGLVLRIFASNGSLWLDEAWSAVLANDVGTPLGVFVGINHDNNHHLNSLWLQAVGLGAPPLVARALSVTSGSLAILVAGLIGARRGAGAGVVTALLFAVSPVLVTLGSEARGYAPMTLMVLVSAWYIDRYLDGDESANRPLMLALCFFFGALFQLTIAFAACALTGWLLLTLWRRSGFRVALTDTLRLLGPAWVMFALALAIAFVPSMLFDEPFKFGASQPFSLGSFRNGFGDLLRYTAGLPPVAMLLAAGTAMMAIWAGRVRVTKWPFYALSLILFPLSVIALRLMNVDQARYFLLAAVAFLLLAGEIIAPFLMARGWRMIAGAGALAALVIGSLTADLSLLRERRGDPGIAVDEMAKRAPGGTTVALPRETDLALLKVAAAEAGYPLRISSSCQNASFLFTQIPVDAAPARSLTACGTRFALIAAAQSHGMSGQSWSLYQRTTEGAG